MMMKAAASPVRAPRTASPSVLQQGGGVMRAASPSVLQHGGGVARTASPSLCGLCERGDVDAVREALRSGAGDAGAAMSAACSRGNTQAVALLLHAGAAPDKGLCAACSNGHADVAEQLLRAGAAVDRVNARDGATPLFFACQSGHAPVVALLLRRGAAADKARASDGATPLYVACFNGHAEVVELLLEARAAVDRVATERSASPLFVACQNGHRDVAELLLQHGAKADRARASDGASPLFIACFGAHKKVVEQLLKAGAAVDKPRASDCSTPLAVACLKGHMDIVKLLLKAGAAVNRVGGPTPLYSACLKGHRDVAELLLRHRAKVDAVSSDGASPLYISCSHGHAEVVTLLLRAGSKAADAPTADGTTPLDSACLNDHRDVVSQLQHLALARRRALMLRRHTSNADPLVHCFLSPVIVIVTDTNIDNTNANNNTVQKIEKLRFRCNLVRAAESGGTTNLTGVYVHAHELGLIVLKKEHDPQPLLVVPLAMSSRIHLQGGDVVIDSIGDGKVVLGDIEGPPPNVVAAVLTTKVVEVAVDVEKIIAMCGLLRRKNAAIRPSTLRFDTFIAAGGYGQVWKARVGGVAVAAKSMRTDKANDVYTRLSFLKEILLQERLTGEPSVVKFVGFCINPEGKPGIWTLTEFCEFGGLHHLVFAKGYRPVDLDKALKLSKNICQGMQVLHHHDVIHRDLKPENVLVCDTKTLAVRIADFGLSRFAPQNQGKKGANTMAPTRVGGTQNYSAPEQWTTLAHTAKVDVFAWGILQWELLTGVRLSDRMAADHPREPAASWKRRLAEPGYSDTLFAPQFLPSTWPRQELADMIKSCWSVDPTKRPSFGECVGVLDRLTTLRKSK
eukprot:TRINITY_DN6305_c0_g1_i3.p1 TRINITY_DN6305_c0_g1~~TRINITY_DN6305_c0_g1_i3.p1  ORF type:complete len:886 (+),score=191.94 TRINITY_DN6305_c0_g1_i3:103-2658(+)